MMSALTLIQSRRSGYHDAAKNNHGAHPFGDVASSFVEFCQRNSRHFVQQGMNSVGHARHYLSGLRGTLRRKNIETIHNDVAHSDYQGMEQFISSSPWCHRALMDQVAKDADGFLGEKQDVGLFLDKSSFLQKGNASVGVQHQWSGRAGKVENCQVGRNLMQVHPTGLRKNDFPAPKTSNVRIAHYHEPFP